jgi:hypothetical protein
MTTNGSLLARKAASLRAAGLSRLTVSLDAISDDVFKRMNDVDYPVHGVLEGLKAAQRAGFSPIKINMVVKRGMNDDEIVPMARWIRANLGTSGVLRFIEYMDVGNSNQWRLDEVLPSAELVDRLHAVFPLDEGQMVDRQPLPLPRRTWRDRGHRERHDTLLRWLPTSPPVCRGGFSYVSLRLPRTRPPTLDQRVERQGAAFRDCPHMAWAIGSVFRDPQKRFDRRRATAGRDALHRRLSCLCPTRKSDRPTVERDWRHVQKAVPGTPPVPSFNFKKSHQESKMTFTVGNIAAIDAITAVLQTYMSGAKNGTGADMKPAFADQATIFGYVSSALRSIPACAKASPQPRRNASRTWSAKSKNCDEPTRI